MATQTKTFTGLTILAILLTMVAALFTANLLIGGIPLTTIQETPGGSTQGQTGTVNSVPYPAAVPMFLAALVLIGGLLGRKLWIAWVGLAALSLLSGLFLFSSGDTLVPLDLILLILLIALTILRRRSA